MEAMSCAAWYSQAAFSLGHDLIYAGLSAYVVYCLHNYAIFYAGVKRRHPYVPHVRRPRSLQKVDIEQNNKYRQLP